jgi:seryl-tRNA synthetase
MKKHIEIIKKQPKQPLEDITEFTDEEGKKWVQTSANDLFSMKEFNDILKKLDQDKEPDEIVLAHIDIKRVNREYYETAVALQEKVNKQAALLKKIAVEVNTSMEKKNKKLMELVAYIRKLHSYIGSLNKSIESGEKISIPDIPEESIQHIKKEQEEKVSIYQDVTEQTIEFGGGH